MRPSARLLAVVKPQYLEAGAPTGIAGLVTHPTPRSTLLYLYSTTLDKLKNFPESSVYRQSTEALTKHRLSIIENVKPEGLESWQQRVSSELEKYPDAFRKLNSGNGDGYNVIYKDAVKSTPKRGVTPGDWKVKNEDQLVNEEMVNNRRASGPKFEDDANIKKLESMSVDMQAAKQPKPQIEPEPALNVDQIGTIEQQIGAGLIEEVIQVAEGELNLVGIMEEAKSWEDLEEKPAEGQWAFFERDTHTPQTQAR